MKSLIFPFIIKNRIIAFFYESSKMLLKRGVPGFFVAKTSFNFSGSNI